MQLLHIDNLSIRFGRGHHALTAVEGVTLSLGFSQTLGLVGESGCGKTLTALSIARLFPHSPTMDVSGSVLVQGQDVLLMSSDDLRRLRGKTVAYVFQDPNSALNPFLTVGSQIREVVKRHAPDESPRQKALELLDKVGIADPKLCLRRYPHQLSGGMRQRAHLAVALAAQPRLLVADEPTTALDVTVQAQILELLNTLRREMGMSILLITHDLGVVSQFADDLAVMYAGQIVETGPTHQVLRRPFHPYTRALLESAPSVGNAGTRLPTIPGSAPTLGHRPSGCRFHTRCFQVTDDCLTEPPEWAWPEEGRAVRCPFWNEEP